MEITEVVDSTELSAKWKADQIAQTEAMRKAMEEEKGLLNIPQSALALDVSRARVCELMKLNILKRFEFFGQIYLSYQQVQERRSHDVKSGRPKRGILDRITASLHAAILSDSNQLKQGDYAGPYQKKLHKDAKEKRRKKINT